MTTKQATNATLTPAQLTLIYECAHLTWNYVGSDTLAMMQESGERMTNAVMYEVVGDADRMEMCARNDATMLDALKALRLLPWPKQVRVLAKSGIGW